MADLLAVERKLNDTGSAVKTNGSLLLQAFATVELLNMCVCVCFISSGDQVLMYLDEI